jgi:hypothetical protein
MGTRERQGDIDAVMDERYDQTTPGTIDRTPPGDPGRAGQQHAKSVRLSAEVFAELHRAAEALGIGPTVLMRQLIEAGLQRLRNPDDVVTIRRTALLEAIDSAVRRAAA